MSYFRADQRNLDESVQGICRQLLANNPRSGNFHALISFFIDKSIRVRANDSQNDNFTFSWSTHNSLFVLKVLCKFFVENITEQDFANQFEIGGKFFFFFLLQLFHLIEFQAIEELRLWKATNLSANWMCSSRV